MDPVTSGILVVVVLLVLMAIGTPIAFALGAVSLGALILDRGVGELIYFGETFLAVWRLSASLPSPCLS